MQVTLAVVLLATVGLAALVGRSREQATAVELADQPIRVGRLEVRLPAAWETASDGGAALTKLPAAITAEERRGGVLMGGRTVTIQQSSHPAVRSPEDVLRHYLRKEQGTVGNVKTITLFGRPGVLARFDGVYLIPDHPFGAGMEIPGWVAAGLMPGAGDGQDLGVVIRAEGWPTAGPAGERLVRQVAGAISVAPRAADTRESVEK